MATEDVIKRLNESRPPATDAFTYLTIIEKSLSPEILPALQDILDDAELTNDIGWDLVDMLLPVPGSSECLERIARLGNPREVILKVLEVMEKTAAAAEKGHETEEQPHHQDAQAVAKFVALVGMLKILHGRLQVRAPSRFLHTTLDTVLRSYDASNTEATAAVIDFVRSLSGKKRPPLPTRQSSTKLDTPFQATDPTQTAPDPEADSSDHPSKAEEGLIARLLQSFITCVIEAYVNSNSMEWASRLLEYTFPEKIVPSRKTMMQAFNEIPDLQAMDALMGQLVLLAGDLGLNKISPESMKQIFADEPCRDPLSADDTDAEHPEVIQFSTAGFACLTAYWMFSADIFDAHYDHVKIELFPDHYMLLKNLLGEDSQAEVAGNPGTIEALVVMAIWIVGHQSVVPQSGSKDAQFMPYLHSLTLVSVFHPNLRVRNAATVIAGHILHADPDEDDRIAILEDLIENCVFSTLQSAAVTWFREELIAAQKNKSQGRFSTSECFEKLQYSLFPDVTYLKDASVEDILDFWTQNYHFHLQVANFALFLFSGIGFKHLAPAGMAAAVEHRYAEPLLEAATRLRDALDKKEVGEGESDESRVPLSILINALTSLPRI